MKDHVCYLTKFDAFGVKRDQDIDLETWLQSRIETYLVLRQCSPKSLRSSEARTHTNHVDFEPIYREKQIVIEKARCRRISGSFGRKPLFHVIARQFKVAEAWVLEINKN